MCHMSIPCAYTFPWVSFFIDPMTLTLEFDHFLKTWTSLITFELWVLELLYCTWAFLLTRPFRGCDYFWHCDLGLGVWLIFIFFFYSDSIWAFLVKRSVYWYQNIWHSNLGHIWNHIPVNGNCLREFDWMGGGGHLLSFICPYARL